MNANDGLEFSRCMGGCGSQMMGPVGQSLMCRECAFNSLERDNRKLRAENEMLRAGLREAVKVYGLEKGRCSMSPPCAMCVAVSALSEGVDPKEDT